MNLVYIERRIFVAKLRTKRLIFCIFIGLTNAGAHRNGIKGVFYLCCVSDNKMFNGIQIIRSSITICTKYEPRIVCFLPSFLIDLAFKINDASNRFTRLLPYEVFNHFFIIYVRDHIMIIIICSYCFFGKVIQLL